jgi:hypothetical protein
LAYAVLAASALAAVAGIVLAVTTAGVVGAGPAWSAWKPTGGGLGAAKEIADHVAVGYRLPDGEQLVDVIAKPPMVSGGTQQIPIHYFVVRGGKGKGDTVVPVSSSDSVMYSVCGAGQSCSIASGKPSVARGTLVRREILELALYTFKYVGGMKNVVAFMPPPAGTPAQYVIYLRREDLAAELKMPLARTLGAKVPLPNTISTKEQQTIDAATENRVYKYNYVQGQDNDAYLVLTPFSA